MVCFEWWAFELLAIFSGYISVASLAAEVVIINIVSFVFMMPLGISFAASSLTGNYIGQGNIPLAKRFASLTMVLNVILSLLVIGLIYINHA
jgi:multidrug resistance protein, MATE family